MSDYSGRAQPYLDAIGAAIFANGILRDWIVAGTRADAWRGAVSLHDRQRALTPKTQKQPFFCNYFCGLDSRCTCRPDGTKGLETDLMAFLQDAQGRILAIHLEYKHPREELSPGQAAAYPMRAACWATGTYRPKRVMPHHDRLCVILCDPAFHTASELAHFDRVISHTDAAARVPGWPT